MAFDVNKLIAEGDAILAQKTAPKTTTSTNTDRYEGDHSDLIDALRCIPVNQLNRMQWRNAGTALKLSGIPFEVFDAWSATDTREGQYKGTEETRRQWDSFHETAKTPTSGWIVRTAESFGWENPKRKAEDAGVGRPGAGVRGDTSTDDDDTDVMDDDDGVLDRIIEWAEREIAKHEAQRPRRVIEIPAVVEGMDVSSPAPNAGGSTSNIEDVDSAEDEDGESIGYDSFFRSYDDIATQKTRPEFDWLMPGVVARGLLTLMTASAGVGKTDTLYQMFDAAVNGGEWLAYRFDRKLSALYVDPEMDECGTDGRFYDIREERKTVYSPNPDYRRELIQYQSLTPEQRAMIDTIEKLVAMLRISGRRYDLIIIDSIAALMPKDGDGNENDNLFIRSQLELLANFAKDIGAGVMISHHTGKSVGQGLRSGNAARGASAWKDVPSVVMEMHPLSTRKSKEAQTMIESLSVERWSPVFRHTIRRFPQPIRLLYRKNRYSDHMPNLNMLYRYPLHIVKDDYWDIQSVLRDCRIAADPSEMGAKERQEKAKERVSDEAKAILAIIEDVHREGLLATCENVYPRFSEWREENGYEKELKLSAFKSSCTPSGRLPFTKDRETRELIYTPDEGEESES